MMKRLAGLGAILILFAASYASGQAQGIATSQSPHGSLNLPCANCHTAQGWKPIRAVPEFDHNQTTYPLRGMHVGVACTACHVKMVFTNVGNKCQDCHADIHKHQLGSNCAQCHTVRGWGVSIQQIQDHNNRFPLTGAHAAVDCDACHKNAANSKFQTMSTNCLSCHMREFKSTTNPDHVKGGSAFQAPCEQCHSTDNWLNAKFDHSATGFLLTGGHSSPPVTCEQCHTPARGGYNLQGATCMTCHIPDYQGAKNPDHVAAKFSTSCETCHTTTAWSPATFDHNSVGFPLTGGHSDPPVTCEQCHTPAVGGYNLANKLCITCHRKDFDGATSPVPHTGFPTTCEQCHDTIHWTDAKFDHTTTGFTLTGSHMVPPRACADCHNAKFGNYNITVTTCVSCHQADYDGAKTPVDHTNLPTTCEKCHNTTAWTGASFDHATTGWPLVGSHTVPPRACTDCHNAKFGNYNITVTTCVSCHQADYDGAKTPVDHTGFPTTCEQCHDTVNWTGAKFDHATTGFQLTGLHMDPPRVCSDCHNAKFGNYNITVTTCVSCHLADFQGAKNPDHVGGGFAQTCELCHSTSGWSPAGFDHAKSAFPLTGLHTVPPRACIDCHNAKFGNYNITVTTCVSCHLTDYQAAKSPDHVGGGFPQTCEQCHNTAGWKPASFDHASTGWPLTGLHTVPPRACTDCHNAQFGNYNITVTTCVSCHLALYQGAKNPDHVASSFPQTCEQCHNTSAWQPASFNHASTGWPLTGSHVSPGARLCTDCHNAKFGNYNITVTTCISCHQTDFNTAKAPVDHTSFPTSCEQCHDTSVWTNGKFDHAATGWPLTGLHVVPPRACTDCHNAQFGNYNITVTTCVSCHLGLYQSAKAPDHVAGGFPQTCEQCHNTSAWQPASFNHASTGWPLTGLHIVPPRACTDCHNAQFGNYNITVTTCVSCHLALYQGAKNPDHVASAFPQTCEQCHNTSAWQPATFNHASTGWPLTGSHVSPGARLCTDCHNAQFGNYNITVTTCVSCHLANYNGAKTPVDHTGFPTTCEQCHDTSVWTNGKFDHAATGWPLVGSHLVPPRACTDCHNAKFGNYNITVTTCISCHQADFTGAVSPVPHTGFPTTCELCHDTIHWTDATFNHNNTPFPLTGLHASVPCANCHINNNYTTLPLTCIGCHQTTYNNTTNPGHAAQPTFFPSAQCSTCHTTAGWTPATFNHTQYTQFSINHGNANGVCATCHTNSNDYSIFQCTQCHGGNNSANFNHPNVQGYVYNSVNCYQCHSSAGGG